MAINFLNRREDNYYIKSKETKKGSVTYFMTKKKDKNCLAYLPEGYEVFEKPDTCIILIRKKRQRKYTDEEIKIIEQELAKNGAIEAFKLEIIDKTIRIYIAEKEDNARLFDFWNRQVHSGRKIRDLRRKLMKFQERMRVIKTGNSKTEAYEFQRYCYRGSIDDWISIGGGENLGELARENIFHLGKESYFDLI